MRVVLTGGAGFLGSHLSSALLGRGDSVVAVDNLCTGRRANVAELAGSGQFDLIVADVVEGLEVPGDVDAVMHFASPASPKDYLGMPIETLLVGSAGTHNALALAHSKGARFMVASTSEVYGDPLEHPQSETYWGNVNSVGPRSCYDEAKRYAEAATTAFHTEHGLDTRILRIFNTYGPRMQVEDGRVVSNFIVQALLGKPITIYGDGSQSRSFCYVDDEVDGILRLLDSDVHSPVNIGNPNEFTMMELADLVVELTGSSSVLINEPLPVDDPRQRRPDIGVAREVLGWEPATSLQEGLTLTIRWFRSELGLS